jgi:hypothetical protein
VAQAFFSREEADNILSGNESPVYTVPFRYQPAGIVHPGDFSNVPPELIRFYIPKEDKVSIAVADFRQVYPELVLEDETDAEIAVRIKRAADFDRGDIALADSRANVYSVGVPDDLSGENYGRNPFDE